MAEIRPARGLHLDGLALRADGAPPIALDARVAPGEVLTVMGPSGAGKSTLLAAVMGTLPPAFRLTGRVLLDGDDITHRPPETRRVGILFQDELLFPHLSVGGNLLFGLRAGVRGRAERARAVEQALRDIELEGFAGRDPATLSGGQKARVGLMRVLLAEPRALLLDEPFARLDPALRDQVRRLVFGRAAERGLPVLLVTHDAEDARAAGGRVVMLEPPAS